MTLLVGLLVAGYVLVLPILALAAWNRVRQQEQAIAALGRRIDALEAGPAPVPRADAAADTAAAPVTPERPAPVIPARSATPPTTAVPETPETDVPRPVLPPLDPSPPAREGLAPLAGLLRWFLQGNPLAKLGVLLLFFGVSYLLRYAAERDLLPIELRLAGAAAGALGLLALGWGLRRRQPLYALILQGGGIGALYITCFAAFRLYALLPPTSTFGLMLAICAASVALAVRQDALSLAVLASLGGYLAPLLLSDDSGAAMTLFSYYTMLSLGILAISVWRAWRPLNLIGFALTFGVATLWGLRDYTPSQYPAAQAMLLLNVAIFGLLAVLFARHGERGDPRAATDRDGLIDGTLLFGTPLIGFGLQVGLVARWSHGPAWAALGYGVLYLPLGLMLLRRGPRTLAGVAQGFVALGAGFMTLAVPLALSAQWTATAWALEGLGILWTGRRQRQRRMRLCGSALIVIAMLSALVAIERGLDTASFLLVVATLALVSLAAAWLWRLGDDARPAALPGEWQRVATLLFLLLGIGAWLYALFAGADRLLRTHAAVTMSALAGTTASALLWQRLGRRLDWDGLRHAAWALWPCAALLLAMQLARDGHAFGAGTMALAWLPAIGAAVVLLRDEDRRPGLPAPLGAALHVTFAWGLLLIGAAELHWLLERLDASRWSGLPAGAGLAYAAAAMAAIWQLDRRRLWPVHTHPLRYGFAALAPVGAVAVALLAHGNRFSGRGGPLGYVPLLNPLELGAAAALAMGWVWQRAAQRHWPTLPVSAIRLVLLVALVWWANGLLLRSLARIGALDWRLHALWSSQLVQTSVALAWTVAALATMLLATRRAHRPAWFGGAALLALVVVKLFLVDAADHGGLARAVAFIGVAVLVLVIGYFAPLPPRAPGQARVSSPR